MEEKMLIKNIFLFIYFLIFISWRLITLNGLYSSNFLSYIILKFFLFTF